MKPYQKKLTRICAIILAVLIVIYAAIFLICKIYLSPAYIKETIVKQVRAKFNRTINVGDDIHLTVNINMSPHLILHDVAISNSTWASNPYIFKAKEIEFHFDLLAILFKNITIKSIAFTQPEVFLETNSRQNNWEDFKKDIHSSPSSGAKLEVRNVMIDHGVLNYNGDKVLIDKLNLSIDSNARQYHFHLVGSHRDLPLKATINVDDMQDYFKLHVVNLQIAHSDIKGELKIDSEPTRITGEFDSDLLLFKDFTTNSGNSGGEYQLTQTPFPINLFKDADINVTAKFKQVDLAGLKFNDVNIVATKEKNVLTMALTPPAKVANGKFNLDMTYDLNPEVPRFKLQTKTTTLQFEQVLEEMLGKSPLSNSTLDFNANLSGSGDNLNALVSSLSGKILLKAGPGDFLNSSAGIGNIFTNVLSSVITFDKSAPTSTFKCGVMNFTVTNGVANAKQGIGIEAATVNVLGNGMVDLRNGRIEFSMVPQTKISTNPADLAKFSVAQLVAVKGTISKPEMTLNPANLLQQGTNALIAAGMAGSISGLAPLVAGNELLKRATGKGAGPSSPCETALGSN